MAIGLVEMQGAINRTQDFQSLQHSENEKGLVHNMTQQTIVEQKVEQDSHSVHHKENAAEDTDAQEREGSGKGYSGDGGKHRKEAAERKKGRVVEKKKHAAFDIKI